MFKLLKPLLILGIAGCFAQGAVAEVFPWYDGRWAQETSDIKPDPRVTFGKLSNGFRYAIFPHAKPEGRASVYLGVQVGSWMEEPNELGLAHYLEHMAFNGSKRFPAGSLIPFFQRHGMNFGGDTNAYTTVDETVFQLNLAATGNKDIGDGLRVLRDVADGLLLEEKEINEERGIILSEKTAREFEATLAADKFRKFLYGDSRLANTTIGLESTIKGADHPTMRGFYERWYVPSRMILVVSGDVKPEDVEPLIQAEFKSMVNKPAPALDTLGDVDIAGTKFFVQKRPISMTSVTMQIMHKPEHLRDTRQTRRLSYCDAIIQTAIARRLVKHTETHPGDWTRAYFRNGAHGDFTPSVTFGAMTDAKGWKKSLLALQKEFLQAQKFGLTDSEVKAIKEDVDKMFVRQVKRANAWSNADYAQALISIENSDSVFTSPAQDLKLYRDVKDSITTEEVNKTLREALAPENRRISISGNANVTEKELSDYWKSIQSVSVKAPSQVAKQAFPYLELPPKVAQLPVLTTTRLPVKDLDLKKTTFTLANGTDVVLLPLTFEKGSVSATLLFGDGIRGVKDDEVNTARLAVNTLRQGGPGRLTRSEAISLLSPMGLGVNESISLDNNVIAGSAQSADVAMLLQTVWTQLQDPTLTERERTLQIKQMRESEYSLDNTVDGILNQNRGRFFNGPDPRNLALKAEDAQKISLSAMQQYLKDVHKRGKRTLVIAGDFNQHAAVSEAVRLFGALPAPEAAHPNYAPKRQFPAGLEETLVVDNEAVAKSVYLNAWHCDSPDLDDRRLQTIRRLVGSVISERMRLKIREELAVAYSPYAFYSTDPMNDGYGYLMMTSKSEPKYMKALAKATDEIVADVVKNGVTDDELDRLKKPMLTAWKSGRRTNRLWYGLVMSQLRLDKPTITWYEQTPALLPTISAKDVSREAKKMFKGDRGTLTVESAKH